MPHEDADGGELCRHQQAKFVRVNELSPIPVSFSAYKSLRHRGFTEHETVNHEAGEYVRGEIHTNTVEGYFSIVKRGLTGVYQHVAVKHLWRYLGEFDFRYNHRAMRGVSDAERAVLAVKGAEGKRLSYRPLTQRSLYGTLGLYNFFEKA